MRFIILTTFVLFANSPAFAQSLLSVETMGEIVAGQKLDSTQYERAVKKAENIDHFTKNARDKVQKLEQAAKAYEGTDKAYLAYPYLDRLRLKG